MQRTQHFIQNFVHPLRDIAIPETEYAKALRFEESRPGFVVSGPIDMLTAVQFNYQATLGTNKICEIRADAMLSSELEVLKTTVAQSRPE